MKSHRHHSQPHPSSSQPAGPTEVVRPSEAAVVEDPLRCVWSGYPRYDRDCRSRIPATVVVKAWHREMQIKGTVEGFFHFGWRNGVWLAYGQKDGRVRGVYCPTHCSERSSRTAQGAPEGTRASGVRVEDRRVEQPVGIALQ